MTYRVPPAEAHGPLRQVLPGVHVVQGSMRFYGVFRFSRNMIVVDRGDGSLVVIEAVRLDDDGLAALDALGRVTDVVRLAAAHGRDVPFYKERYGATVWDVAGQRFYEGTHWDEGATYFRSDRSLRGDVCPPLAGARLFHFGTQPPEAALLLPHHGGVLVPGDVLQNWCAPWRHFNLPGQLVFRGLGMVGPVRVARRWVELVEPDPARVRALLDLDFRHVLPLHGDPVLGDAKARYRPAIEAVGGS